MYRNLPQSRQKTPVWLTYKELVETPLTRTMPREVLDAKWAPGDKGAHVNRGKLSRYFEGVNLNFDAINELAKKVHTALRENN